MLCQQSSSQRSYCQQKFDGQSLTKEGRPLSSVNKNGGPGQYQFHLSICISIMRTSNTFAFHNAWTISMWDGNWNWNDSTQTFGINQKKRTFLQMLFHVESKISNLWLTVAFQKRISDSGCNPLLRKEVLAELRTHHLPGTLLQTLLT